MWHSPGKSAPSSHHRHQPGTAATGHKGKAPGTKSKVEVWDPLRGWEDDLSNDQDLETIDIDLWSKKNNKRKTDGAKDPLDGMEVYLCWTSDHCPEIHDFEEFVSESLAARLKPVETAPSVEAPSPPVKQTKAKLKPPVPSKTKSPVKNEGVHAGARHRASEPKCSGDDSGRRGAEIEAGRSSLARPPMSTAEHTAPGRSERESPAGSGGDGPLLPAGDGAPARPVGGTRSAPALRAQGGTERTKGRKSASAKLAGSGDGARPSGQMRRAAMRNSAAKLSLDLKRLTLDMPPSASPDSAGPPDPGSPPAPRDEASSATSRPGVDGRSSVLRLVEERLKRNRAPGGLHFDLPDSGSVSVGDLLSSSPRIVHRLGPAGGGTGRDPNVYRALTGSIALGDRCRGTASPWSPCDGAVDRQGAGTGAGTAPSGVGTREASRSTLPSVSSSGGSVVSVAPAVDSASSRGSVRMRQGSPEPNGVGHQSMSSAARTTDDAKILKKSFHCAISSSERNATELPMTKAPQHRGPPGFRPAGKTPLQRAVESAHKKMHGQHYYLFTHSSNTQSVDVKNLPRYSSKGQPVQGHRERASSGKTNQSERSVNNAYVWKEQVESQMKQQRTTPAPSGSNTGGISHQQTNPRSNQSSSATSVPLTLMPSQTRNRRKFNHTFSWENGRVRPPSSSQCPTGMATP